MKRSSLLLAILCLFMLTSAAQASLGEEIWGGYLPSGEYYTILGPNDELLLETGREVYLNDQYLTSDNLLYEVVEIDEAKHIARATFVEEVKLEVFSINDLRRELGLTVVEATQGERGTIALYHTHNAESYVPTDGTDSINGRGGIHKVGQAFQKALEKLGVGVDYSEELHLPHDRGAYRRSRETVLELLSKNPDAIFDIHRDAAPQGAYAIQLGDQWMTSVQFVVGRQNQNLGINRKYAQSLKKIADDLFPGLVKGIFYGKGNYNQDLTPLSVLLEVGAHTNSRPAAERGISLFAEVVDFYFYGPTNEKTTLTSSGVVQRSILLVLAVGGTGVFIFYTINAGGLKPAWERVRGSLRGPKLK